MQLDQIFSDAVDIIFTQFDSVAVDATFTQVLTGGFNFSTGQPLVATTTVRVRGIPLAEKSDGATTTPSEQRTLFVKSGEVVPSFYSSVTFRGDRYRILSFEDNGYLISFQLVKDR